MNTVYESMKRGGLMLAAAALVSGSIACGPSGAGSSGAASPNGGETPAPKSGGASAPDFTLSSLDGDTITLSDYEGDKVVLLDFWATTCDPCLAEMPELVAIYKERKDKGFEILAITIDGPTTMPQVPEVVKNKGMIFPVLLDTETEVMDRYNPKGQLPYTVVIDRNGKVVLRRASYTAGDEESMRSLIDAIDGAMANK